MQSLADNAYSRYQLPDYSENVRYQLGREDYHPRLQCEMKCRYEKGQAQRAVCIDQCLREETGSSQGVPCAKDEDCPRSDICVMGGPYSGMADRGECMDPYEPFTMEEEYEDGRTTCAPGKFYDASAQRCEPRFQGPSSAWAVNHPRHLQRPEVWIPGATTCGYGVGDNDPFDVKTDVTIY